MYAYNTNLFASYDGFVDFDCINGINNKPNAE